MRSRLFAGVVLMAVLTVGCASGEDTAESTGSGVGRPSATGASGAGASSAPPKLIVLPDGEALTAPPTEFMEMSVHVTFVGGPADGKVDHTPLGRLKEKITISGVVYESSPVFPPEVIDTPQGTAHVFRPVAG